MDLSVFKAAANVTGVAQEGMRLPEVSREVAEPTLSNARFPESVAGTNNEGRELARSEYSEPQQVTSAPTQITDIAQVAELFNRAESPIRLQHQEPNLTPDERREQSAQAVMRWKDEILSAIDSNREGNAFNFYRHRKEFPQEIASVFTQAIDKLWQQSYREDLAQVQNHLPTARETLAGMASDGMFEVRQLLPMETRIRAAFLLSWPVIGLEVTKEQQSAAKQFMFDISDTLLMNFHDQPIEQTRMLNLKTTLENDPLLGRYGASELAQSEEMRKEFLTRASEIVANHHGMTPPPISFYSVAGGDRGSVPGLGHEISYNTNFDDIAESELVTRLTRLAVHETRHVYQNAIIKSEYSPEEPDTKARLTTPIGLDENTRLLASAMVVDGIFLYHSQREKTGSFEGSEFRKNQAYQSNVLERDSRWAEEWAVPGYLPR